MLTRDDILEILKNEKPRLSEEPGVEKIGLFGSYSRREEGPVSDIDIFVELPSVSFSKLAGILIFLENRLNHKVDLVRKHKFMKKSFLERIERESIVV